MLHARLMNDVISIIKASNSTLSWYIIRSVASKTSQTTIAQMISTEARAPSTSARWYPNVYFPLCSLRPIQIENMLIAKPATSDSI